MPDGLFLHLLSFYKGLIPLKRGRLFCELGPRWLVVVLKVMLVVGYSLDAVVGAGQDAAGQCAAVWCAQGVAVVSGGACWRCNQGAVVVTGGDAGVRVRLLLLLVVRVRWQGLPCASVRVLFGEIKALRVVAGSACLATQLGASQAAFGALKVRWQVPAVLVCDAGRAVLVLFKGLAVFSVLLWRCKQRAVQGAVVLKVLGDAGKVLLWLLVGACLAMHSGCCSGRCCNLSCYLGSMPR